MYVYKVYNIYYTLYIIYQIVYIIYYIRCNIVYFIYMYREKQNERERGGRGRENYKRIELNQIIYAHHAASFSFLPTYL